MESLKATYDALPKEEKIKFLTSVMPDVCDLFKNNPQEMMKEMMPACKEMMKECNMDMSQIMSMMSMMKK